jgi:HEAT repeat protein
MKSMHIFLAGLMACGLCTGAMAQEEAPAPAEQAATAAPTEADLVAILQGEADWNAKTEACRVLKQIGTAASVPALAALLNDDALSHYARYALEVIPGPEATKALIAALANVNDTHKAGIAATLGVRRDEAAIPPLADLLPVENDAVSAAASAPTARPRRCWPTCPPCRKHGVWPWARPCWRLPRPLGARAKRAT